MNLSNLKEWMDQGYVISKHISSEVISFRKYKSGIYRVFKGSTTIENCKVVEDKDFNTFLEKARKLIEKGE